MKITWEEKKERIFENDKAKLKDVVILGKNHDIEIMSRRNGKNLFMSFYTNFYEHGSKDEEFRIHIFEGKIRFGRHRHRHNHDHNNFDNLYVNIENGEMIWMEDNRCEEDRYKLLEIPFGGIESKY